MGYKTIAIEQIFDHSKKETIKRGADIFPVPAPIEYLRNDFKNQARILQRLTIIYTDVAVSHAMVKRKERKYLKVLISITILQYLDKFLKLEKV